MSLMDRGISGFLDRIKSNIKSYGILTVLAAFFGIWLSLESKVRREKEKTTGIVKSKPFIIRSRILILHTNRIPTTPRIGF